MLKGSFYATELYHGTSCSCKQSFQIPEREYFHMQRLSRRGAAGEQNHPPLSCLLPREVELAPSSANKGPGSRSTATALSCCFTPLAASPSAPVYHTPADLHSSSTDSQDTNFQLTKIPVPCRKRKECPVILLPVTQLFRTVSRTSLLSQFTPKTQHNTNRSGEKEALS